MADTWTVEETGHVDKIYRLLKVKFDETVVAKEPYEFDGGRERTHMKVRNVIDDKTSLQFRNAIKHVQTLLQYHKGKVHVKIDGDAKGVTVRVEDV